MDISHYSLSVGILTGLLQYFPKNRAILVQKLGEEIKLYKYIDKYISHNNKLFFFIKSLKLSL